MKMIRHQRIRGKDPRESIDAIPEQIQKGFAIVIIPKDVLPVVASRRDVQQRTRELQPKWSRHRATEATSAALAWDVVLRSVEISTKERPDPLLHPSTSLAP